MLLSYYVWYNYNKINKGRIEMSAFKEQKAMKLTIDELG